MKHIKILLFVATLILGACTAQQKVLYLQDVESGAQIELPDNYILRLKPLDQITIVVNNKNPELAVPFNSATSYNSLSGSYTPGNANENSLQILTVDEQGYVNIPILGKVHCAGMTRDELAQTIEQRIEEQGYMSDPQVNVRFAELTISVLGEVNKPGRYNINRDQITILEAIALAGDMTIFGQREDVAVVRECNGKNVVTKLDLRSADIFSSPCYYLEQNDIIIVSPNKYKAATSEINQNRSFWISLASTAVAVATLVMTIIRK
jgi:polysaccharide export outer membrane protein